MELQIKAYMKMDQCVQQSEIKWMKLMSSQSKEYPGYFSKVKSGKNLGASYKFIVNIVKRDGSIYQKESCGEISTLKYFHVEMSSLK